VTNLGWQDLIALAIVFAAAGYLLRLAWGAVGRKAEGGCGTSCGKCPAGANAAAPRPEQVVSIGTITPARQPR
jgi:hypothetical protein